jgi:hypothetical protein
MGSWFKLSSLCESTIQRTNCQQNDRWNYGSRVVDLLGNSALDICSDNYYIAQTSTDRQVVVGAHSIQNQKPTDRQSHMRTHFTAPIHSADDATNYIFWSEHLHLSLKKNPNSTGKITNCVCLDKIAAGMNFRSGGYNDLSLLGIRLLDGEKRGGLSESRLSSKHITEPEN